MNKALRWFVPRRRSAPSSPTGTTTNFLVGERSTAALDSENFLAQRASKVGADVAWANAASRFKLASGDVESVQSAGASVPAWDWWRS